MKNNLWLFTVVLLLCFAVSSGKRFQQFEIWKENPTAYFVGERPLMTTLDAPYWLGVARNYNEGEFGENTLISYPSGSKNFQFLSIPAKFKDPAPITSFLRPSNIKYSDIPLLSFLIAKLTPFFSYNYYLAGTLLVPILASLFILPLGIYFFRINVPLSGLLGGLIGTFAGAYYMRSSIGRIDTDMLNLFFPFLSALLILFASLAKSERKVLLYSAGAGLSLFLLNWWYQKPGFTSVFFAVIVCSLFVQRIRIRTILFSSFLFVLCANPSIFLNGTRSVQIFISGYFGLEEMATRTLFDNVTSSATFPNVMATISEATHSPMDEVLRRILSNKILCLAGLLMFLVMSFLRWKVFLPLAPIIFLGFFSFMSSNRFAMYLAPLIGIGIGWILSLVIEGIFIFFQQKRLEFNHKKGKVVSDMLQVEKLEVKGLLWKKIFSLILMDSESIEAPKIGGSEIPSRKSNEAMVGKEILTLNVSKNTNISKKEESKVAQGAVQNDQAVGLSVGWLNWVRQGFLYGIMGIFFYFISVHSAISFVPGPSIHPKIFATFIELKKRVPVESAILTWWDFGHTLIDLGFATFHDGATHNTPKTYFIARGLISSDEEELYDITQFLATEGNRGIAKNNTSPEALIQAVRNPKQKPWDPIFLFFTADMTGKYGAITKLGSWDIEKSGSNPRAYQNLSCNKITNEVMNCRGANIDLKAGFINNQLALQRVIFIRNGEVLREKNFGNNRGFTLQLIVVGNNIVEVQLLDEAVYQSNYNQMFLLGRYRKDLFEETYNAFPFSRSYKFKF